MANNNKDFDEGTETLSLRSAYTYLIEKGYENDVLKIKESKDKYKSYTSTLKRCKIVDLLENNNLLNEFIENYWKYGKTESGKTKIRRYKNILNRFLDNNDEENEEIEENETSSFAYEDDLRDYLANNLNVIEPGLKLFNGPDGKNGIEYVVDNNNKRIDILAIDKEKRLVVIELKVSQGYEKVIGQTLYYKNMVKELFNNDNIRIVIIAKEITKRLKKAVEDLQFVELYEYNLSVSVKKV
jgi:RecB family endonuclease NucS